jgi:hypothetical protein
VTGDIDDRADRAADRPNAPCVRRVDVRDLRRDRSLGATDLARGHAPIPYHKRPIAVHVTTHDPVLPLGKAGRVGDVRENVLGRPVDFDRGCDR